MGNGLGTAVAGGGAAIAGVLVSNGLVNLLVFVRCDGRDRSKGLAYIIACGR